MATTRNGNDTDVDEATDPPLLVPRVAGPNTSVVGPSNGAAVGRGNGTPVGRGNGTPVGRGNGAAVGAGNGAAVGAGALAEPPPPLPSTAGGAASSASLASSAATSAGSTAPASLAGTPGPPTPGTPRNKRQELSFAERIQVIFARCGGKSMRQLASEFGCGKTQILNILGQRESYLREWEEKQGPSNPHISARKRRSRRTGNEETNKRVWEWYQDQKALGIRVTGPMLQREARSIARGLGIANFAASNGWLDSFRRLHNIVS